MEFDRLKLYREPEDEEEEDEEDCPWRQSGRECDYCFEGIPYAGEVFVLEVMEAAEEDGKLFHDILRDDDGEYLYRPYLMHIDCWEEALKVIDEEIADQPPVEAEDPILRCSRCESTIGNFEPFVATTFGEISVSDRMPSGRPSAFFEPMGKITPICLLCITHIVEIYLDEWEELLEALPEIEHPEGEQEDE